MTEAGPRRTRRVLGPFTLQHLLVVGAVLVVAAGLLVVLSTPIVGPAEPTLPVPGSGFYQLSDATTGLSIGQRAPELETEVDGQIEPLRDLNGAPIRLADYRGDAVWLNFFATWCPPCQEETPVLRDAYERYAGDGLQMIAVSVQETTAADVAAYAETYSLPYTIGFDASSAIFHLYEGFGLPTHLFLDRDGIIRRIVYGPLTMTQISDIIEPLLAANAA